MKENLQFPIEYFDSLSGKLENKRLKEALYAKYLSHPPSKRVNHLKNGNLTPFYAPAESILKLNGSDNELYILRNVQLIRKLDTLFFNKNKQLKLNSSFTEKELEQIGQSYLGIRLVNFGQGNIERFALVYKPGGELQPKNSTVQNSINKLVSKSKLEVLNEISNENAKSIGSPSFKPTLNKLLRRKFNKSNLLIEQTAYEEHETCLLQLDGHQLPIGFVLNSGLTLLNGRCSSNAFVLTKSIYDLIQNKSTIKQDPYLVNYKSHSSNMFKKAKITSFYYS